MTNANRSLDNKKMPDSEINRSPSYLTHVSATLTLPACATPPPPPSARFTQAVIPATAAPNTTVNAEGVSAGVAIINDVWNQSPPLHEPLATPDWSSAAAVDCGAASDIVADFVIEASETIDFTQDQNGAGDRRHPSSFRNFTGLFVGNGLSTLPSVNGAVPLRF